MLSINTTASSTAALSALRQTNAELSLTQKRIASGLKVSSAQDNSTIWAAAQGIRSDLAKESTVSSGLSVAKGRADLTLQALNKISEVLTSMKAITDQTTTATSGDAADVANTARSAQLDAYQAQLIALTRSVTFQGVNWLQTAASSPTSIILSTSGGADVSYSFVPTEMYASGGGSGSLKLAIDLTTTGTIADETVKKAVIDNAITAVTNYTNTVKSLADTVAVQQEFIATMSDIRKNALSELVDADMTEESAKLQSLQVKQQLAYQALSIGNNSAQNILRLFQ